MKISFSYGDELDKLETRINSQFKFIENLINYWGKQIMAGLADFQTALQSIDAETTRIGEYIASIVSQLNRTDLTDEQEQELLSGLKAAGERLKNVGTSVETPVPPGELPEIASGRR